MLFNHVHHALGQLKELREKVVERQTFRGYSGPARMAGGIVALAASLIMCSPFYPSYPFAHVVGWGFVLMIAVTINFGALFYWFLFSPGARRNPVKLRPVIDALSPLVVGGIITFALILKKQHDLLFGMWMCLFGLAHLASRHALPKAVWYVGCYYILCGFAYFYILPNPVFTDPRPMGLVFGLGELMGGYIFYKIQRDKPSES